MNSLLVHLPRQFLREAGALADRGLYRRALLPLWAREYSQRFHRAVEQSGPDPFLIVAVPDILHFLVPCIRLATRHVPVVLVINGMRPWEEQVLADTFPAVPRIRLATPRRAMLEHGLVLELALRFMKGDLRLHDPDLYVFDPRVYEELRLREGEVAAGAFGVRNEKARITFPTTHLVALRGAVLRELMKRHRIGPRRYRGTPPRLAGELARLGLGDDNFPKAYLAYYDVLHLLLAVAASEGSILRSLDAVDERVFHLVGVSYLTDNYHLDYLHHRFLALPTAKPFAERYLVMLRGQSLEAARARFRGPNAEAHLRRIDASLDRLTAELER